MTAKMEAAKERLNAARAVHAQAAQALTKATDAEREAKVHMERAQEAVNGAVAEWIRE